MMDLEARRPVLEAWIRARLGGEALRIVEHRPLSGGAIQENWLLVLELAGREGPRRRQLVLRRDSPAVIGSSLSRAEEFRVLEVASRAGVRVPEPIGFCEDPAVLGAPFGLTAYRPGTALGPKVVKDQRLGGDRLALARTLGRELAKVHQIRPPVPELDFLGVPARDPARAEVARLRAALDRLGVARPALEWGLRYADVHAPPCPEVRLLHGDFRTGNYLLDEDGLSAILDWEFATFGDPMADLGWFTAECWRFGRPDLEAGGIGPRDAFYGGYEELSDHPVRDQAVRYWELMAHIRWGVIALEQGERHLSGVQPSLELALTGRVIAELELAVLRLTPPAAWRAADAG